ncbi:MAG: protein involved in biosynthesis of mitomycin antibiotics/polyketide fumonisin [Phycisphaerales bacterium]|nr:protein involved in biosynthesis of mitomycin antibiotics/polyketide fumonisin [Phycisphaerales bacterium]
MTESVASIPSNLARNGFAILHDVVAPDVIAALINAVGNAETGPAAREKNNRLYAMRDLLRLVPEVRQVATSLEFGQIVEPILGPGACPVRGILFDKTAEANWKVAWHQDLSIAVRERFDIPGFGPWSVKAGIPHVQPPAEVLANMLTVRLHLDDCTEDNGPLMVLPGSHAQGVLSGEQVAQWKRDVAPVSCCCAAGGVVLMRPLLLHASSQARKPGRRRVVHVEFAGATLPGGLQWFEES